MLVKDGEQRNICIQVCILRCGLYPLLLNSIDSGTKTDFSMIYFILSFVTIWLKQSEFLNDNMEDMFGVYV